MRTPLLLSLFLLVLSASTLPAVAQYTAGTITFAGAPPSQHAALEATANLHTGQNFSAADLQSAAQRLSDTGAFDDVQVALKGPFKSIAVNFALKPVPVSSLLEVSFSNFFWFTPEELATGVRARVPLFGPSLPEAGNLVDAVQTALEDMLHQRGITAKVTHDATEPSPEHQGRLAVYRVSRPLLVVHAVHLGGISDEFATAFRARAGKVVGSLLDDSPEHRSTDDRLLLPYLNAGYLQAHIADRKLTPITTTPDQIELDLAGTVVPGPVLHVGTVSWTGSPELSSAAFAAASPIHTGDLASVSALSEATGLLAAPYRKEGYADVVVEAARQIDASSGTISYTFTVLPGEQYRIHTITPLNLTAAQQADFDRAWRMKAGELFNPDYISGFLKQNTSLRSFENTSASYRAVRDPGAHLVDVTITFVSGIIAVKQ